MGRLIDFYRGTGTDTEGRTLAEIWGYSQADLEDVHDFIQWLFPLREPSRFNPDAPRLSPADVAAFRASPELRENLRRSFDVFLAFVGLRREAGEVVEAPDFAAKSEVWRFPNHNWLRITRVLASARLLGLEAEASALFEALKRLRDRDRSGVMAQSFAYWDRAARDDLA